MTANTFCGIPEAAGPWSTPFTKKWSSPADDLKIYLTPKIQQMFCFL